MLTPHPLTRRRFLTITAALAASPVLAQGWQGTALGARARIRIDHPKADAITAEAVAEIARLERIFSLYQDSALVRLNRSGRLDAPPFELLECLALCDSVYRATSGLFDPTIQPLWATYAESHAAGHAPQAVDITRALDLVGWEKVAFDETAVWLRPGMALTLNGVAQGFVADKVAALLQARGLRHVLIDTGELRALGPQADGAPWPVQLAAGGTVALTDRALASSSALGTTFDAAGRTGHILSPRTGLPAASPWALISVTAPSAGLADALSTAACLMTSRTGITTALGAFAGVRLEHLA
ncbi:FAD:protein FMN transferase [Rhodobacter sp. KR11]|uniref:FAD:protein FMN transferase n=1 Tax=Rhodobacter sp. KR11 TaxID=2974588 RepID=UPI002223AABB|nr:FAD:protein FMN transferase [Rhodobacter sp. KR11]MCW1917359.1 FAD:protein FMN transferase [Rhodobacter sp. KR11]